MMMMIIIIIIIIIQVLRTIFLPVCFLRPSSKNSIIVPVFYSHTYLVLSSPTTKVKLTSTHVAKIRHLEDPWFMFSHHSRQKRLQRTADHSTFRRHLINHRAIDDIYPTPSQIPHCGCVNYLLRPVECLRQNTI